MAKAGAARTGRERWLWAGALGLGLLGAPGAVAPAAADGDHVRSYHWRLRGPADAPPGEGYGRYRERLGPHSGYADGENGYLDHRERYGPAPSYTFYRPVFEPWAQAEVGSAAPLAPEPVRGAVPQAPWAQWPPAEPILERRLPIGPVFDVEAEKAALLEESGWTPLNEGRLREAMARLEPLAEAQPELPIPSVGLAVAAAELGDRRRSLEAMRRALTHLPEGVRDAPIDAGLRTRLRALGEREARAKGGDAAFLSASFAYLGGDLEAARAALARIPAGEGEPASTRHLRALVEE